MKFTGARIATLIIIFAMGVGVIALFANFIEHIINPTLILLQPSQITTITLLELLGMAISFVINRGRPPFRLLGEKRAASQRR